MPAKKLVYDMTNPNIRNTVIFNYKFNIADTSAVTVSGIVDSVNDTTLVLRGGKQKFLLTNIENNKIINFHTKEAWYKENL